MGNYLKNLTVKRKNPERCFANDLSHPDGLASCKENGLNYLYIKIIDQDHKNCQSSSKGTDFLSKP